MPAAAANVDRRNTIPSAMLVPARMAPQLMRVPTEAISSTRGVVLAVLICFSDFYG